jgi:hypothetical protein
MPKAINSIAPLVYDRCRERRSDSAAYCRGMLLMLSASFALLACSPAARRSGTIQVLTPNLGRI